MPPLSKGTEAGANTFLSPYSIQSVLALAFCGGRRGRRGLRWRASCTTGRRGGVAPVVCCAAPRDRRRPENQPGSGQTQRRLSQPVHADGHEPLVWSGRLRVPRAITAEARRALPDHARERPRRFDTREHERGPGGHRGATHSTGGPTRLAEYDAHVGRATRPGIEIGIHTLLLAV